MDNIFPKSSFLCLERLATHANAAENTFHVQGVTPLHGCAHVCRIYADEKASRPSVMPCWPKGQIWRKV